MSRISKELVVGRSSGCLGGLGEDPLEEGLTTTPVSLPGESIGGGRSLACYSSWGCEESDTTEVT